MVIQVRLEREEGVFVTEGASPSTPKVLASTRTRGPLFQLGPEEPHSKLLPGSTDAVTYNPA